MLKEPHNQDLWFHHGFYYKQQGRLKALSTGGTEGILYRVMKLKNPIVFKGRESGNIATLPEKYSVLAYLRLHSGPFCIRHLSCTIALPNLMEYCNLLIWLPLTTSILCIMG